MGSSALPSLIVNSNMYDYEKGKRFRKWLIQF